MVGTLPAAILDALEACFLAFDDDAFEQASALVVVQGAKYPHSVFALYAEPRVHQLVGEFARIGEQQQAFGIHIQSTDRLPLTLLQARQMTEHGWTALWVVERHDLARRLVISQNARRRRRDPDADLLAIQTHDVSERDALPDMSNFAIHFDLAFGDHVFDVTTRADSRLGQHLLQLGRVGFRRQYALAFDLSLELGQQFRFVTGSIELSGQNLSKTRADLGK